MPAAGRNPAAASPHSATRPGTHRLARISDIGHLYAGPRTVLVPSHVMAVVDLRAHHAIVIGRGRSSPPGP
jgi:hypothetical protein